VRMTVTEMLTKFKTYVIVEGDQAEWTKRIEGLGIPGLVVFNGKITDAAEFARTRATGDIVVASSGLREVGSACLRANLRFVALLPDGLAANLKQQLETDFQLAILERR
jgi:hypothetical protein